MRVLIRALMVVVALAGFGGTAAAESETHFTVKGDLEVAIEDAEANLTKIRGKVPAMTITSGVSAIKKHGQSYSVNLFFSDDFTPAPATFPIAFAYAREKDTLGASMMTRGGRFSHDTEGSAEFLEFGDRVRVRFEFRVFDQSEGSDGRRQITVTGEATCPGADIF